MQLNNFLRYLTFFKFKLYLRKLAMFKRVPVNFFPSFLSSRMILQKSSWLEKNISGDCTRTHQIHRGSPNTFFIKLCLNHLVVYFWLGILILLYCILLYTFGWCMETICFRDM